MLNASDGLIQEDPGFAIRYFGTACFILEYQGKIICIDPGDFLTARLTKLQASSLPPCDLILVSHADFDHRNRLALVPRKPGCTILGTKELANSFPSLDVDASGRYETDWITVDALPVTHALRPRVEHVGFRIVLNGKTLLFMGDGHTAQAPLPKFPDYLFVTIGGFKANPASAAALAISLDARNVIPMHWERLFRSASRVIRLRNLLWNKKPRVLLPEIVALSPVTL